MGIVRESLNFKRGLSDREIRSSLFGFRPGQIILSRLNTENNSMKKIAPVYIVVCVTNTYYDLLPLIIIWYGKGVEKNMGNYAVEINRNDPVNSLEIPGEKEKNMIEEFLNYTDQKGFIKTKIEYLRKINPAIPEDIKIWV